REPDRHLVHWHLAAYHRGVLFRQDTVRHLVRDRHGRFSSVALRLSSSSRPGQVTASGWPSCQSGDATSRKTVNPPSHAAAVISTQRPARATCRRRTTPIRAVSPAV